MESIGRVMFWFVGVGEMGIPFLRGLLSAGALVKRTRYAIERLGSGEARLGELYILSASRCRAPLAVLGHTGKSW